MEAVNGKQLKSLQIREMYEFEKKASGERQKERHKACCDDLLKI